MAIQSLSLFSCSQNKNTSSNYASKVIVVALTTIALLIGVLTLSGIPSLHNLGTIGGELFVGGAGLSLAALVGFSLYQLKKEAKIEHLLNQYPSMVHLRLQGEQSVNGAERQEIARAYGSRAQTLIEERKPLKGFLWEIRKEDAVIYLVGTVHTGFAPHSQSNHDQAYNISLLHPKIKTALESTEVLYLEMVEKSAAISDSKLFSLIPLMKKREELVLAFFDNPQSYATSFNSFQLCLMQSRDYLNGIVRSSKILLPQHALEATLTDFARIKNIKMCSLETVECHFETFRSELEGYSQFPYAVTAVNLNFETVHAAQNNDIGAMTALYQEFPECILEAYEKRNPNMLKQIIASLEKGERALFGIGSAHFMGPQGLIDQLVNHGYTPTFIPLTDEF